MNILYIIILFLYFNNKPAAATVVNTANSLLKIKLLQKGFHSNAIEEPFSVPQRINSVKGSLKNHLFLNFL